MDTNNETPKETVDAPLLTKWKNAPTVRSLKEDLTEATSNHSAHQTKVTEWLNNLRVEGSAQVKTPEGNSKIVPKLIRKQAEWRYAALSEPFLSTNDLFNVEPVTWEDTEAAAQNQLVLSNQFNTKINKVTFIDDFVRTAVDEGTVIARTGWAFEEEEYIDNEAIVQYRVNPELAPLHQYLEQLKTESPSQYATDVPEELKTAHDLTMSKGQPIEAVVIGHKPVKKMRTVKNCPTVEVCDGRNVIIDPTCLGDIDKAGFVIYSFESSLSELGKDKKYKNLEYIGISTSSILGEPDHSTISGTQTFNFQDKPRKKFVVYEYWGFWDIHGTGEVKPIVAAWVGETLIRLEENPYPDKKVPFVVVPYLPIRRSIYGEPDGALLEENQKVVGAVTRGMIDIMARSANGQVGIRKDMLDTTNRRKFDKGMDYEYNANVDPRAGVYMHTYPEIPRSAEFMLNMQNAEAESLTGVKSFSQGMSGASLGNVATSVRGVLDAASKRELGILRRLAKGIEDIGRKFISMNAEFLSDEEIIRITNKEFIKVRKDDLPGNFDLTLSISTAEVVNAKAEELAFMLQTMGNTMGSELTQLILSEIAKLRKMPLLAKKIETFQPQPDPIMQEKAQLENDLIKAQIALAQAHAQHYASTTALAGAKVNTEAAKAGHLKSDTDLKNLAFIQDESGVEQERKRQLQEDNHNHDAAVTHMNNSKDLLKAYLTNSKKRSD